MSEAFKQSKIIELLDAQGNPPDLYRVEYHIQSLEPTDNPEIPAPREEYTRWKFN